VRHLSSVINATQSADGSEWLRGECLGNPACGAGIRGLIPGLGTASFLPYPPASILLGGQLQWWCGGSLTKPMTKSACRPCGAPPIAPPIFLLCIPYILAIL